MVHLDKILSLISVYSVLLPFFVGLSCFEKLDANSRLIVMLTAFASISQLASRTDWAFTYVVYNSYMLVDAILWGYIFFRNSNNIVIRRSISFVIIVQVIVAIYVFSREGMNIRFHSEFVCWSSLVQSLLVLSFFYERYKREEIMALEKEPMFWFCLGILIYAPATYFRFAYYGKLKSSDDGIGSIHHFLNTGMYLVFAVGILANVISISKLRNVFIRHQS